MSEAMKRASVRFLGVALLGLLVGACEGSVLGELGQQGGAIPGGAGSAAVDPQSGATCTTAPGAMYLRRLTNQEYADTVVDLLGGQISVSALPPDLTLYGFDNNAESLSLSPAHLEAYRALAEQVSSELVASETRRAALVGCDPTGADGARCLASFVKSFGARTFRRPLSDAEAADIAQRASSTPPLGDGWSAVSYVVQALLQAPSFLFRVEVGEADAARPGLARVTGHELATRLSYLLWGTMPDQELFDVAASGALSSADGVEKQALAMLDDARRAQRTIWSFTRQWLRIGSLSGVARPATDYPLFNETVRGAMEEETRRLVEDFTSRPGVPLLGLLDSESTFVDAALAPLYGVTPPASGWAKITPPAEQGRRGLLTHPSVLTLTGSTGATAPILRGKYVRQVLLCDELPPPPPEVSSLPPAQPGLSERERLAQHRSDPACSACHALLEPLGFGLSRFDAIGRYVASDPSGNPIDAQGTIEGLENGAFSGSVELALRLRREPKVAACISTHLMRFALGRKETAAESCTIGQLSHALSEGGDYRELVRTLVRSDAFRYRPLADSAGAMP
jgi:hypothetical protein